MIWVLGLGRLKPLTMMTCEIVFKGLVVGITNVKDSLSCVSEVQLFQIYLVMQLCD